MGKMMSSDTYLKLSVTSVAKYNSEILTWVVEHLCAGGGGLQEYVEMRIKIAN